MLRKSDDELLLLSAFSKPLYELMVVGVVSGIESYLHARLRKEVLSCPGNIQKYIKIFWDAKHGLVKSRNLQDIFRPYVEGTCETSPNQEVKNVVIKTLNCHSYHNLKILSELYYEPICGLKLTSRKNAEAISSLVQLRHKIAHDGGRTNINEYVELILSDVEQAFEIASSFIEDIEHWFCCHGSGPLFIEDPTELDAF